LLVCLLGRLSLFCRRVRLALRLAALGIGSAGLLFWLAGGLHLGWSKTTVTRTEIDEVTGLKYPVSENRYVFGVEMFAATLAVSGGLFGLSLAFRADGQSSAGTTTTSS